MTKLPPGQRAVRGFPRFGVDLSHPPPPVPDDMTIKVCGDLQRPVTLTPADLGYLPRRKILADLHCVAGWSAVGLAWEGVPFRDLYGTLIEPALTPGTHVQYVVFVGLDGYRSIVTIEDALGEGTLVADRLDGKPLTPEHGAPVRLVSPHQYGFISTKHLSRIELYRSEPATFYHPTPSIQRALRLVRPHERARVWEEERHRHIPPWLVRRIYRLLVRPPAPLL